MRQQNDRDVVERHGVDFATVERDLKSPITNAKFDRRLRKIENPSLHFRSFFLFANVLRIFIDKI